MRYALVLAIALAFVAAPLEARPDPTGVCLKAKKPKKKKKKTPEEPPEEVVTPSPSPSPSPVEPEPPPPPPVSTKKAPVVEAPAIPTVSGKRKASTLIPGSLSRWSNAGAMEPIASEVEITAPLPSRAVPLLPGQDTPGQRLIEDGERISAHLSLFGDHMETVRQDANDIDLVRARATLDYDRIGGSDFGLHLDLEYRGNAGARRLTDRRINAAYASYGALDFRRDDGPRFGIALGRVAIREAGYAQVDGGALRFRILPEIKLGIYGGVTGNPHVYNWQLRKTEDFSTDWIGGGLFGSARVGPIFADFAYGLTIANKNGGGLDRMFAYVDAGWAIRDDLDLFLTGWVDFIKAGTALQSIDLLASYAPSRNLHLRVSASRYATVIYAFSTLYSYRFDPAGNAVGVNQTVVDGNGAPIVPFDAVSLQAVYDELGARLGYRVVDSFEPYVALTMQIREAGGPGSVDVAALRLMPVVGATFRHPAIADISGQLMGIVDAQTDKKAIVQLAVGRDFGGFRPTIDMRAYVGGVGALEGGLDMTYTFAREMLPGRLLLRGMVRYTREDVAIARPPERCLGAVPDPTCAILGADAVLPFVPLQESFYSYAGVDWRF